MLEISLVVPQKTGVTDEWILSQKLRTPKTQLTDHRTLKKEDLCVGVLVLLRRGTKFRSKHGDKVWSRD